MAAGPPILAAASRPVAQVLTDLGGTPEGLTAAEAARRLAESGPNAVRNHQVRAITVLVSQLRSPLLLLLAVTAVNEYRRRRPRGRCTTSGGTPARACCGYHGAPE